MATLTEEQLSNFKDVFDSFDKNGDGKISVDELGVFLRAMGHNPTGAELRDMIQAVDANKSGFIEFQEFINMMSTYPVNPDEEMLDAFKTFDKDNDGKISAEELRYIVKLVGDDRDKLTDKEVNDLLEQADLDGDGKINYEEFVKMMNSK